MEDLGQKDRLIKEGNENKKSYVGLGERKRPGLDDETKYWHNVFATQPLPACFLCSKN